MGLHRHVADFVQKQRAAFGLLKAPDMPCLRAGEGPFLMSKELGLDQLARDCGHVDRDERPVTAFAVLVKRAGNEFLARSRLTGDHDRKIGLREARQNPVDILHRRAPADQRHAVGGLGG